MAVDTDMVRDRFDIVDVVSGYMDLKKAGKNYHGCCPFHDEKTPSFTVAQDKQFYHCFGCGAHGDVIGFVSEINRVDFIDAIKILDSGLLEDDRKIEYVKTIRSRFYLGQEKPEGIDRILSGCDQMSGHYFTGSNQVLPLVNAVGEVVCLAMAQGRGFDIRFLNKSLIWGSYFVIGNKQKPIVLVVDYWQALKLNHNEYCVVCVFDPLNICYVITELRRVNIGFDLLCIEDEDFIQAEKTQVYNVFNKTIGNYVVADNYLDNKEL